MHAIETRRNKWGEDSDTDPTVDIMRRQAIKAMAPISCEAVRLHSPTARLRCVLEAPQADLKALEAESVRFSLMSKGMSGWTRLPKAHRQGKD